MNKTNLVKMSGLSLAILAGSFLAVTAANAHHGAANSEKQLEVASEIAERFDLDEAEVQSYFEEKAEERKANREERRQEHLAGLVAAGTLSQEQADQLKEMRDAFYEKIRSSRDSSAGRDEMKTLREEHKEAMQAWAEEQGINLDDIHPEKEGGRSHHARHMNR